MAKVYTYPHWETQVIDNSIYTALDTEVLPLFRPIFFMRAQQGPVQVPVYVHGSNEATAILVMVLLMTQPSTSLERHFI